MCLHRQLHDSATASLAYDLKPVSICLSACLSVCLSVSAYVRVCLPLLADDLKPVSAPILETFLSVETGRDRQTRAQTQTQTQHRHRHTDTQDAQETQTCSERQTETQTHKETHFPVSGDMR